MGSVIIRRLSPSDAQRCSELERILFPGDDPWSAAAFRSEMGNPFCLCLAAVETGGADQSGGAGAMSEGTGELVGYAILAMVGPPDDPEFEVHTIGVDPAHQRRGIGRQLLEAMLAAADERSGPVFLEVRCDNEPAITLYERYGFVRLGVRRNYYQPSGADAYTMRRDPVSTWTATEDNL
ncbi:ribosomal protein S18-alanine N-acetyltransferase [Corynebacterium sp. CCM 9203]|uniref:ribosomal protein S18-alanine N-acetyltransferase n=1 Tax=Corynebacterium sp. CCM 9203 TaxID=3057615 RepID=UPI0035241BEE